MKQQEDNLRDFFSEMKKAEETVEIPDFETMVPTRVTRKRIHWKPLAIAASFLVLIALLLGNYLKGTGEVESTAETEIQTKESVIDPEAPIHTWESPSASLIDDF